MNMYAYIVCYLYISFSCLSELYKYEHIPFLGGVVLSILFGGRISSKCSKPWLFALGPVLDSSDQTSTSTEGQKHQNGKNDS